MATLLSPISTLYHHAPSLRGGLGSIFRGVDGVGARCGNGLFSTYNSPKFYLSFTILVLLFILVRYPDRIGLVNTLVTYEYIPTVPYSLDLFYPGIQVTRIVKLR